MTFLFQLSSFPCMRRIRLLLSVLLSFCLLATGYDATASRANVHARGMPGAEAMECHSRSGVHAQASEGAEGAKGSEGSADLALALAAGEKTAPSCCVLALALFGTPPSALPRPPETAWRLVDVSHKFSFLPGGIYRPPRMNA